jgi:hypothetical protein
MSSRVRPRTPRQSATKTKSTKRGEARFGLKRRLRPWVAIVAVGVAAVISGGIWLTVGSRARLSV